MKNVFIINNLDCANCAAKIEREISKIEGVESVSVNFLTSKIIVEYDENNVDEVTTQIENVIKKEDPDVKLRKI